MMEDILKKLYESMNDYKNICWKRLLVLSALMIFIVGVAFLSVLVSTSESVAKAAFEIEKLSEILKSRNQNLDELFDYRYIEVCKRDKELAYIYLRKNLKAKNLSFTVHRVTLGENFWGIAKQFGINIDTIIGANPDLTNLVARVDQEIIVLSRKGVIHEVVDKEEDMKLLTQLYGVTEEDILAYNELNNGKIAVGDVVFIPGAKPVYMSEELSKLFNKRSMFRSPLSGVYTSVFGYRIHPVTGRRTFHDGVDIRAKIGTWVGSAADGKVVFAGWNGALGYCVKIRHKNGYTSLYGHLSRINVKPGQKVFAGKLIAKTGNSGRTTGPHLHFGIYKKGKAQDPLKYLW